MAKKIVKKQAPTRKKKSTKTSGASLAPKSVARSARAIKSTLGKPTLGKSVSVKSSREKTSTIKSTSAKKIVSSDQLYKRRLKSIDMIFEKGMSQREAARVLGVNERAVRQWVQMFRDGGKEGLLPRPKTGAPQRLNEKQIITLEKHIIKEKKRTKGDISCPEVAVFIKEKFGVTYHPGHVWKIVQKVG
jgi:transposase